MEHRSSRSGSAGGGDQGPFAPVTTEEAKRLITEELAKYFRLVSTMLEVGAMTVDFYNAEATVNPARPNSQFCSLKGEYRNLQHGLVFNAWQYPRVNPELFKEVFYKAET